MASRLPVPGSDDGAWGNLLNDFLSVEHNSDGTLKPAGSLAAKAADTAVVHLAGSETITGTKTFTASPVVPTPSAPTQAANKSYVDAASALVAGTVSQYYRGDKTWQTLDKTAVGLPNVDNTADASKPLSTAATAALATKLAAANNLADVASPALARLKLETASSRAMFNWYAGLANRHYAPAKIVAVGDSFTEGQGASSIARRWTDRLIGDLRRRYPTNGSTTGGENYYPAYGTLVGPDSTWTPSVTSGSVSPVSIAGLGMHAVVMNGTASITWTVTGDSADIRWFQYSGGGHFTWQVDGGATTDINTSGATNPVGVVHIALGAAGAHTVRVNWISGNPIIEGLAVFNGDYTTGIQLYNAGRYGYATGDFTSTATTFGSNQVGTDHTAIVANIAPQLILLALGANDWLNDTGSRGPAVVKANLQTLITAYAGFASPPTVLLITGYNVPQSKSTSSHTYDEYVQVYHELAASNPNVAVQDFSVRFPNPTTVPVLSATDTSHLSDMGQGIISDMLLATLSAR